MRATFACMKQREYALFEYFKKVETPVSESARNKGLKEEEKNEVKKQRR